MEEIYEYSYKCPSCGTWCIFEEDNYCCECGVKLEWEESILFLK